LWAVKMLTPRKMKNKCAFDFGATRGGIGWSTLAVVQILRQWIFFVPKIRKSTNLHIVRFFYHLIVYSKAGGRYEVSDKPSTFIPNGWGVSVVLRKTNGTHDAIQRWEGMAPWWGLRRRRNSSA
jgi:hypothetical protein